MKRIVIWVFLLTVVALYVMDKFHAPSVIKFFVGAFGFGTTAVLMIIMPLLITYKDEP